MFKRVTWFVTGAVAGAGGSVYARRRLRLAAQRYRPVAVARTTAEGIKRRAGDVGAAVHEGRSAMRQREADLRAAVGDPLPAPTPAATRPPPTPPEPADALDVVDLTEHPAPGRRGPRRRARR